MNLWIDNTGLQSAALCLEGRASSDYDVRGLLQLATLIVYGRARVNGFEDEQVRNRSEEAISRLRMLDVTSDAINLEEVDKETYAAACRSAASRASLELAEGFCVSGSHPFSALEPPELPRGTRERQEGFVSLLREPEAILPEIAESALAQRAMGAVDFMVASSPGLREQLSQINFGFHTAYQVNVYLRFCLNECLGRRFGSRYAPSVARAELVDRSNISLLRVLEAETSEIVAEFRSRFGKYALGIPSTWAFLLHQSRGDPRGLLIEAGELRSRTRALRSVLVDLDQSITRGDYSEEFDARRSIGELGSQIRARLQGSESKLADAISLKLFPPSVSLSLPAMKKWYAERKRKPEAVVLTDIAQSAAVYDANHYDRLTNKASRNSSS